MLAERVVCGRGMSDTFCRAEMILARGLAITLASSCGLRSYWCPTGTGLTVTEVCRRYGISGDTFYAYRRRYRAEGLARLEPRSRRPHVYPPHQTPAGIKEQMAAPRIRALGGEHARFAANSPVAPSDCLRSRQCTPSWRPLALGDSRQKR